MATRIDRLQSLTMAKITFLGAAGAVTGSKYLVEAGGKRLLVDCGLFQGPRGLREKNREPFPVEPASIDWIVLTHAHIDHTGYLPRIVSDGFRGPIFANAATHELCNLLLLDSAHLQEEDAKFAAKKGYSRHHPPLPLYTTEEAQQALTQFREVPRSDPFTISPQFTVKPYDAGHILGSSSLQITITENGKSAVVVFSGDVGRYNQTILNDPAPIARADYILCESTYGDRDHPTTDPGSAIAEIVNRVNKRGGVIVIPAFAVGRTQTLMYILRQLEDAQQIPKLPTFVDSPMAASVTDLYVRHHEDHRLSFQQLEQAGDRDPLDVHEVHMTRTVEESKKINAIKTPCIIMAASGMCTGGRILHHLEQRLPDARNVVIFAGYQAEATLGRYLLNGGKDPRIHGDYIHSRAEIAEVSQFSAHSDRTEMIRWLSGFQAPPKRLFLIHGEPAAAQSFSERVQQQLHWPVAIPKLGDSFDPLA
ncbi:MAG TPA: MBL fold metallo-hydrolase [Candidatus Acidoferrales bacterium]|nr:MBL fold metallo-hydrolase [Candidatus Acidoferrales bacterium]